MGLYISRRTLHEVGYELTLEPSQHGHGARFRIAPSEPEEPTTPAAEVNT